jgi:RNA polymerase sigma-70 factor (ECF subfamily)
VSGADHNASFDQVVLSHLDAAYNLARWLSGNDHDAADIVQEACVRALRGFGSFRGGDARVWLLTIVRNTAFSWLRGADRSGGDESGAVWADDAAPDPAAALDFALSREEVRNALEELPLTAREIIVLRDIEGLSYKSIAVVLALPEGTVMSRLARARDALRVRLAAFAPRGQARKESR